MSERYKKISATVLTPVDLDTDTEDLLQKKEELVQTKTLHALLRHIEGVQLACKLLANKLIEKGECEIARLLVAESMLHDNSKFYGLEWQHLVVEPSNVEMRNAAIT